MSDVYYLASDTKLKELKNPYIIYKKRGVIMSNALAECYPRTFSIDKKEYGHLPLKRKYVLGLDFRWQVDAIEMLIQYMQDHLTRANEIELLNVWLGGNDKIKSKKILVYQLDYIFLRQFMCDDENLCDITKLTVMNRFY